MPSNQEIMMSILTRRTRPFLQEILEDKFFSSKEWLLAQVQSHPVTQELMGRGPSGLIGSQSGTLYGFIGFDAGSQPDPAGDLLEFLTKTINFIPRPLKKNSLFSSSVQYPSKDSFNAPQFVLPWTNRGWPVMIEEGISGLQNYINLETNQGRSEEGVQANQKIRSGDWSGMQYLTPIFAEFRKKLLL